MATTLPHRAVIQVQGPDTLPFLQALVTQDLALATPENPLLYGCLLTPQGKFLHDMFLWVDHPQCIRIDCERPDDLVQRLSTYKLRAQVAIERLDLAVLVSPDARFSFQPDPRHKDMGARALGRATDDTDFAWWDRTRMALSIPDGGRDADIGVSTLEELNIPRLNGVSFTKGCYVGQELTARMEHRGLGKKHLRGAELHPLPADTTLPLMVGGKPCAAIRSHCAPYVMLLASDEISGGPVTTDNGIVLNWL